METIDLSKMDVSTTLIDERSADTNNIRFGTSNMSDMVELLKNQKLTTKNYAIQSTQLHATIDDDKLKISYNDENGVTTSAVTNNWAARQAIAASMGDATYHQKMLKAGLYGLAEDNINEWWSHKNSTQLLRVTNGKIRAVLGSTYLIVDNYDILIEIARQINAINTQRIADDEKPLVLDRASVSEGHAYFELFDTNREYDIGKGDLYTPMITIRNSDVGGGALGSDVGFFRWACQNMQTKDTIMKKVHRGERLDPTIYGEEIVAKMSRLWAEAIGKGIEHTMKNSQLFDTWAAEMRESKEIQITDQKTTLINVQSEFKMNDNEINEINQLLATDKTILPEDRGTGFALIGAMTQAAKKMNTDREHEIAKFAGRLTDDNNRILVQIVA